MIKAHTHRRDNAHDKKSRSKRSKTHTHTQQFYTNVMRLKNYYYYYFCGISIVVVVIVGGCEYYRYLHYINAIRHARMEPSSSSSSIYIMYCVNILRRWCSRRCTYSM